MSRPVNIEPDCDFVVVRGRDGFTQLEKWRVSGRLEQAMHKVVADMFDGVYGSLEDRAEFALGFIAAIDVIGRGRLRITTAENAPDLKDTIMRAYEDTHGRVSDDRLTDVFTRACAAMTEKVGK